ncbi:hypothetical protein BKA65DRAFT_236413 [Rhexocercosporidium sp. MPI-PUGE-AT-0058]|nr:hypothetical protein BKA65DRAFT_236413 [Rhexocercosporidium sp. MPI-PUGE-AT-0058]
MFLSTPLSLNSLLHLLLALLIPGVAVNATSSTTAPLPATTANLFNLAYPVVAFPFASDKNDATTYLIACPTGTETSSCEFEQPFTMIEGPKTLHFAFVAPTASSTQTFILDCALRGTTSMGCLATGVSDNTPPSAKVTTTEALTYTGDAAKGFFRSVSLVTDSRALMTHTPGVMKAVGVGVYTTTGDGGSMSRSGSETRMKSTVVLTGSGASATKVVAATVASPVVVLTTSTVSSKASEAVESRSVLTDSVMAAASTTPFVVSPSGSGSASGAPISTSITASGGHVGRVNGLFMAFAILGIAIVVGESFS